MSKAIIRLIKRILNPFKVIKAIRIHRKRKKIDRAAYDPQLKLYADFLTNDMLHYGYFGEVDVEPSTISIHDVEVAQLNYANLIIEHIIDYENPVLDVGCGMGGLANLMKRKGLHVEALTPDKNQEKYIRDKYPGIPVIRSKFEEYSFTKQYGTIINAESLQYIKLDKVFEIVEKILIPGGRWIICDYFRKHDASYEKSGHTLDMFMNEIRLRGWHTGKVTDITANVLPTLKFVYMFGRRFLKPFSDFAVEKIKVKQPGIYYLAEDLIAELHARVIHGIEILNPDKFFSEKQYMFMIIQKYAEAESI